MNYMLQGLGLRLGEGVLFDKYRHIGKLVFIVNGDRIAFGERNVAARVLVFGFSVGRKNF